jgi:hypothetical protein
MTRLNEGIQVNELRKLLMIDVTCVKRGGHFMSASLGRTLAPPSSPSSAARALPRVVSLPPLGGVLFASRIWRGFFSRLLMRRRTATMSAGACVVLSRDITPALACACACPPRNDGRVPHACFAIDAAGAHGSRTPV